MALVPWSPLKNGFLSGKHQRNVQVSDSERAKFVGGPSEEEFKVIDVVAEIAEETNATAAAMSLAWLPGTGWNGCADHRGAEAGEQPR
ncbi:Aldo/keto reductase family protein [Lentzea waywayandensis]|uniref:Aldo/keto reductase family protein n=1 Tax=Lentzea waywayandensis TaxID=84724 RepID=A0A1I6FHL0_9PSEU|nr:aldo/keto reductase [Lentzea waywayandensis]SFR29364.1 Aldo/keto reductase family protein [Lentzea waywayandensis]